jgi:hypothetical protein
MHGSNAWFSAACFTLRQWEAQERLKKFHSRAVGKIKRAVFFGFGFVSAQLQVFLNLRLRQSLAKTQKSPLRTAAQFL